MKPDGRNAIWATIGAVAATYVYFLIFAEFAFLALVQAKFAEAGTVKLVMSGLGLGGVLGSAAAAWSHRREHWRGRLALWFAGCAVSAALVAGIARGAPDRPVWMAGAVLTGLTLGGLTVTLASGLRAACPGRLGVVCGAGTGLGYAFCNVPAVFTAGAAAQCWIAAAVAAGGVGLCGILRTENIGRENGDDGWKRWLLVLAALVWMDSAAFAVIQRETELRAATWTGESRLWAYAALHLLAALWAGWALQLRFARMTAGAAWTLLAGACVLLAVSDGSLAATASWPYVAAVSLYSAVLVYVPARTGNPWIAAAVYGIAGWIGSALGIGMAQDLSRIPGWFAPATAAVVPTALLWRRRGARGMLTVLAGLMSILTLRGGEVERGREVYIAEGCIHCHSQYVRPGTRDVEWWGPVVPLSESLKERPPLYGNRRQGPDLTNVGLRRTEDWNRVHLADPQALSPGSRMPSYAYLFAGDGARGNELLAYLGSLGEGRADEWARQVSAWSPVASEKEVSGVDARRLFAGLCAPCHGERGEGNGPLAGRLAVAPPDFAAGWRRPLAGDTEAVARVVKFGLPGTAMAGHETLRDAEVVSLARFVMSLHPAGTTP